MEKIKNSFLEIIQDNETELFGDDHFITNCSFVNNTIHVEVEDQSDGPSESYGDGCRSEREDHYPTETYDIDVNQILSLSFCSQETLELVFSELLEKEFGKKIFV